MITYFVLGAIFIVYVLIRTYARPSREHLVGILIIGLIFWPVLFVAQCVDKDSVLYQDLMYLKVKLFQK